MIFFLMIIVTIKKNLKKLLNVKSGLFKSASKGSEKILKSCLDIATSNDPLSTAIEVSGMNGIGVTLSRLSASQCAGIVGLIITSIHPQVKRKLFKCMLMKNMFQATVPLLLKKISEDLDHIKESLKVFMSSPLYMAHEQFSEAMQKLDDDELDEVKRTK